jgi:Response receiver domain
MSALNEFVLQSATSYLQSVVFVDDQIYDLNGKPLEIAAEKTPQPMRSIIGDENDAEVEQASVPNSTEQTTEHSSGSPAPGANNNATVETAAVGSSYHPRELMESFAQKGIVCALYEPRKKFSTDATSDLFRLCERADVVILDWDLHNDDGDGVCSLLAELINQSQSELPHHVRLCAIYTSRTSLHQVLSRLHDELLKGGVGVEVEEGRLRLMAGATKITIFGKPPAVTRVEAERPYEVEEAHLAERIIQEFAGLHHGIMPALALHGLASIRRNTKRLLEKFRGELDGAFLLHRALALGDREAFEELPELLSDEIRAVIEDMWPSKVPMSEVVSAAVGALSITQPDPTWKATVGGAVFDVQPAVREMLVRGEKGLTAISSSCVEAKEIKDTGLRGIKSKRLNDLESMVSVNGKSWSESLAALFSNRTQYGADLRKLRFGTIVRHKTEQTESWSYSLCLMPICDSQRLKADSRFPFWKLTPDAKCGSPQKRFGIVVEDEGITQALAAGGKIRDMLWIAKFTQTNREVIGKSTEVGRFIFESDGMIVEWVAELKPLHAQRVASHLGSEVSRVGLVESEWLRLFCDR